MRITNEYLKDLYYRSLALGFEYAEIDGFKYKFKNKYCVLSDIDLKMYVNNAVIDIPDYFDRVELLPWNFNKLEINDITTLKILNFGLKLKYISSHCFANIPWVARIYAPGVKKVGNSAFLFSSIIELDLPNVLEFGADCFRMSQIVNILCPKLQKIGKGCFDYCTHLVYIDTSKVYKIERMAFHNCYALTELNLNKLLHYRFDMLENCSLSKLLLNNVKVIELNICKSVVIDNLVISPNYYIINTLISNDVKINNVHLCNVSLDFNVFEFKSKINNKSINIEVLEK